MRSAQTGTPVLYLDIDGTVRQGKDDALGRFVNGPEDVVVFPEAVEMMRRWKAAGGRVIGVSNQGGIALGIVDPAKVAAAMMETHRQADHLFDKIAWCSHHPDAKHPEMARCWCRKPMAGLLIESAMHLAHAYSEMYPPYMGLMVGDRPEDEGCAASAGLDFQWAAEWRAQANPDNRPNSVEHVVTITATEDPELPGLPAAEWRCACGDGSSHPISPPTAERRKREHLAMVETAPNPTGGEVR